MAQANAAIEEGKKFMKQGHKLAKGGIFSKANPDDAEKMYEKARKKFRFIKPQTPQTVKLHLESCEALATVRETMNLNNSAASVMEEAARTCQTAVNTEKKEFKQFKDSIPKYLEQGSMFYRLNNQYDLASRLLIKAANNQEDIMAAIKLLDQSCDIQESENRYITCHEFFDASVKFLLTNKRYKDATTFLDRQNKMYGQDQEKFGKRLWRNICAKMVIQFHLKDVKTARSMYFQGMEEYGNVANNDEYKICEELLKAFEQADAEELVRIQKNAQLGVFLINSVARIATKLNMNDIKPLPIETIQDEEKGNDNNNNEQVVLDKEQENKKAVESGAVTENNLKSDIGDAAVAVGDTDGPDLDFGQ